MEDPKSYGGSGGKTGNRGSPGIRVPAKGDSSATGVPPAPNQASDPSFDNTILPDQPADPNATVLGESSAARRYSSQSRQNVKLQPGDVLAGRYEILDLLGEGGMGAVYKASDNEVNRTVALKLIRADLAADPAILGRFRQELLTAHQVTHKNVIRIYDLSEADGVRFITMEFIEGVDLRRLQLDHGKFPPDQAVEIIRQVCLALDAAHSVGVIHRDLKPQNIMRDKSGRILVMDFGLARSQESSGMTQTGALLGTLEYMSPEQAMGKPLDQRSDLFAIGLIFYELLTNTAPYKADTAMASLLRRNQERAIPAAELDSSIPKGLSDIVSKCLERDVHHRYQTAQEILSDLDAWQGSRPIQASIPAIMPPVRRVFPWKWSAVGALALAVMAGGWILITKFKPSAGPAPVAGPEVSLAILPFHNAAGDASLDWIGPSLADMLTTDVGQSAHVRIISSDRLHQILKDLRIPANAEMDPDTLRHIAEFSSADTVVSGQYAKFGDQIRIDATLLDLKQNRRAPLKIEAANEKAIPKTVDDLAELIRKNLAVSPDVLKELKASSFQPTSKSVPALRNYNQGEQLLREGKTLDAVKQLQAAVKDDPGFALAYARLAETDAALGYDSDAEKNSRKAVELSQQLPLAEKYLIEASHARIIKDNKKAIEAYETLAKSSPGNNEIQYVLGGLYQDNGELDKARAHYSNVLKAEPKNLDALIQTGWLEVQNGTPQAGLDSLNRALTLSIEVENQEQKAQVLQAIGMAYEAMNKFDEALRNLDQAREINVRLGKKTGIANSVVEIANVQASLGKPDAALAGYTQALTLRREIGAKRDAANTLIAMGSLLADRRQSDKALQLFKESLQIQRDVGDELNQALCLNNIGAVYEQQGKNDDALTYYQQSLQLREKLGALTDIADTLHNMAAVYSKTARYDQAMTAYMRALDIRHKRADNHAAALESDGIGLVFLNQGRLGAAVNSLQEAVKNFRDTQDRSVTMGQVLSDDAKALAASGKTDEARKILDEAQAISGELKNDKLAADILITRGDILFYNGDRKPAKDLYQQALQSASRAKAEDDILILKLKVAELAIADGRSHSAIGDLRGLIQQADKLDLKYLSLEGSVDLAEALISGSDYSHAEQELQSALSKSEKLGSRYQTLRIHYLLGNALRLKGSAAEAAGQYQQAVALLEDMKKEPGAEHLLDRSDLKAIYAEATHWTQAGKV
jgi:serine/threonine protein kinase/tetratricopeptide (TPR) repeat protein